jgi:hypothetical protein
MSLFNNPKTSDYTKLNEGLIILEKMFRISLKNNNTILNELKLIIDGLVNNGSRTSDEFLPIDSYEEDITTYIRTVPKKLCAYLFCDSSLDLPNTLFNYYNSEVFVYGSSPMFALIFHIDKFQ